VNIFAKLCNRGRMIGFRLGHGVSLPPISAASPRRRNVDRPPSLYRAAANRPADRSFDMSDDKSATLYRMVFPEETCPFGLHAKLMLEDAGFAIDEHILKSREEVDAFEREHDVDTTPQIFIGGKRIGGSDDLERYLSI